MNGGWRTRGTASCASPVRRGSRRGPQEARRPPWIAHDWRALGPVQPVAQYDVWGPRWTGRVGWAARALNPSWVDLVERATPRQRSVFGFPGPGDPYWDDQTLDDTQARYPRADLTPYR